MVNFSSAGSSDPEGKPLTYSWNFGDNTTSTAANPTHTYNIAGPYQVRLTVSDGVNSTLSTPLSISAGDRPTATILSPTDGVFFKAGDVISFSGSAIDVEDAGATLFLDGIAHTAPFVYDTLIGFNHIIEARNQTIGTNTYTFASWSDGGAQTHAIVAPGAAQTYTANFNVATPALAFVQVLGPLSKL